jgi:hypothetical protein
MAFLIACQSDKQTNTPDPEFAKYVQAFTSETISTEAVIVIHLAQPVYFSFHPKLEEKQFWLTIGQLNSDHRRH